MKKGDYKKAYISLRYLNETPLQAARELYYIHAQFGVEAKLYYKAPPTRDGDTNTVESQAAPKSYQDLYKESNYFKRYITRCYNLLAIPRVRHATISAFVVMISQQLCGVNIIGEPPLRDPNVGS